MADTKNESAKDTNKSEGTPVAKNEAAGVVKEYFDEKGAESAERRAKGGEDVTISLVNKTMVEFTSDFGKHIKKGHKQEVSDQAFEIYNSKGVIKKL